MKIQIVSDLHLEFLSTDQVIEVADRITYNSPAQVLILAGDICSFANRSINNLKIFSEVIKRAGYDYTFYVPGNHEYYGTSRQEVHQLQLELFRYTNIYFLDGRYFTYFANENVTFYGTTLWFEENVDTSMFRRYLNDYRCIQDFTPDDWSRKATQFIKSIPDDDTKKY